LPTIPLLLELRQELLLDSCKPGHITPWHVAQDSVESRVAGVIFLPSARFCRYSQETVCLTHNPLTDHAERSFNQFASPGQSMRGDPWIGGRVSLVGASDLKAKVSHTLLSFYLLGPANWATLEAMDHSSPPGPALFLRLMLKVRISRFSQLFSNFRITHPILRT